MYTNDLIRAVLLVTVWKEVCQAMPAFETVNRQGSGWFTLSCTRERMPRRGGQIVEPLCAEAPEISADASLEDIYYIYANNVKN